MGHLMKYTLETTALGVSLNAWIQTTSSLVKVDAF